MAQQQLHQHVDLMTSTPFTRRQLTSRCAAASSANKSALSLSANCFVCTRGSDEELAAEQCRVPGRSLRRNA